MSLIDDLKDYGELSQSSFNIKLSNDDSSYNNTVASKLTEKQLFVWLNEPAQTILNIDFKRKIEEIITPLLYPKFVVMHRAGLNLVARKDQPANSARALVFNIHYGLYKRLVVNNVLHDTFLFKKSNNYAIELMKDYFWEPVKAPHLAIQAVTRAGKTKFYEFLLPNLKGYSKMVVKDGAIDDGANSLVVIDPKIDPKLRMVAKALNAKYICPDFSKNDLNYLDKVNSVLKQAVDTMHRRAEILKDKPNAKFKDVWIVIDEGLEITNLAGGSNKSKNSYFSLLDRLLLMSASTQQHILLSGQSFASSKIASSEARLQFQMRILLQPKITEEQAQFLFKELDSSAIDNLIVDEDEYGSLGVGIVNNGDGNVVPFKAPYIKGEIADEQ